MLSVTGEKPRNRKVTVTALVAPLVLASALEDVDDPINDYALSGKEAGATVYAITSGTLAAPTGIEVRIATGSQPEDPWVINNVSIPKPELVVDDISDAGSTGKQVLQASSVGTIKNLLNFISRTDVPTATVRGGAIMAPRQSGVNLTSTGDTASTATDVAGLLVDLNDLISKYNTLRTDVTSVNTNLNSVIVALKTSGVVAT